MRNQATKAMGQVERLYARGKRSFAELSQDEKATLAFELIKEGQAVEVTKSLAMLITYQTTHDRDSLIRYAEDSLSEVIGQCSERIDELFDFAAQVDSYEARERRELNTYSHYETLYQHAA